MHVYKIYMKYTHMHTYYIYTEWIKSTFQQSKLEFD